MTKCHALIPCGGTGQRLGGEMPKQYLDLLGKPMVNYCLDALLHSKDVASVWVGISSELSMDSKAAISWPQDDTLHVVETAGASRHQTVLNTLKVMLDSGIDSLDWVLVHDAARPGITVDLIERLVNAVLSDGSDCVGGILALPVADSLKQQKLEQSKLQSIPQSSGGKSRDGLWQAQTPQMFRLGELKDALENALLSNAIVTDEASAFERIGKYPLLIQGSNQNLKVTYPDDWSLIKKIIQVDSMTFNFMKSNLNMPKIRVGQGYDVHQLVDGRPLILGGITIPNERGLLGHSDADALLHALTDALLGSVGLGDIGKHFPDTDPKYKGADSMLLLIDAYKLVKAQGYAIGNIDATIICQKPKLASYLPQMALQISRNLEIEISQINIKAKTNEGLGYLGASEAIATEVVVMVHALTS